MSEIDVWDSSRPRPGRRFEPTHELVLHNLAIELAGGLRGASRGLVLLRELVGPIGIPDFTALIGDPDPLEARLALDVPPLLNEIDAGIAGVAHAHAPRSAVALARALGWPEETILRRLPGLLRSGALVRAGDQSYTRPEGLVPVGRVIAIEAKLKDWRGALTQARGYGVWADNYVIVMGPISPATISRLAEEVKRDSGGLVVGEEWVVRPRKRAKARSKRMWASEHVVAGLVGTATGHHPSADP
jgi:DNA-binding Lrp family transcriptional regulator